MIKNNRYQAHLNIEIAWEEMAGFVCVCVGGGGGGEENVEA